MAEVLAIVLGFLGIVAAWCFAWRYYVHHKRDLEARAREQARKLDEITLQVGRLTAYLGELPKVRRQRSKGRATDLCGR